MNSLIKRVFQNTFEGHQITCLVYDGKPAFIAREVGRVLGYSDDGSRLVTKITGAWSNEFIEGTDYVKIEGAELAALKASGIFDPTESVGALTSSIILLFESGLYMVCLKTNKPIGIRLRRWAADEMLPSIARTGSYGLPDGEPITVAAIRERRLESRLLVDIAGLLQPRVGIEEYHRLLVRAAEKITGERIEGLAPVCEPGWLTQGQITANLQSLSLKATSHRVGKLITQLGLRKNAEGLAYSWPETPVPNRRDTWWFFSPAAVAIITTAFKAWLQTTETGEASRPPAVPAKLPFDEN
jgi:prophage antirepressor-like protein